MRIVGGVVAMAVRSGYVGVRMRYEDLSRESLVQRQFSSIGIAIGMVVVDLW